MKRSHAFIAIVVIVIILAAFFAGYFAAPKKALAPSGKEELASVPTETKSVKLEPPAYSAVTIHETASTSPSISVEYPKFPSLPASFNSSIALAVNGRLADFKQQVTENEKGRQATKTPGSTDIPMSTYSFLAKWQKHEISEKYVSFVIRFDSYVGGANENEDLETFNYDISGKMNIGLADLFPGNPNYLKKISALVRTKLVESLKSQSNGDVPSDSVNAGTEPVADNFKNFTFDDSSVTFYFPKYTVAPGAFGEQKVTISRDQVK